jgi:isoprenylcysteine carboxyl methyltransferase (ICMT) family protein YpbQ
VAVVIEIAAVPLAVGAWRTAVIASGLDALVLRRRVAVESRVI